MRIGIVVATTACALALPASASALTFASTDFDVSGAAYDVAVGDFNEDGDPDLAVANITSQNVSVLLGQAGGGFGQRQELATEHAPVSVALIRPNWCRVRARP